MFDFRHTRNPQQLNAIAQKKYLKERELKLRIVENATLFGTVAGGGIWVNGKHLCNAWWLYRHTAPQTTPPVPEIKDPRTVVYIGLIHGIWGHYVTDHLRFLGIFQNPKFEYLKKYPLAYFVFNPKDELSENFLYLLKKIGIQKQQLLKVSAPTQFQKVIIPDECFFYEEKEKCHYFTKEYSQMIEKITADIPILKNSHPKIYYSRTRLNNGRDINEIALENIFKSQGFEIIYPETLPIQRQLEILKSCQSFATTEGSIAHNAIFCAPNTEILILRKCNRFTTYQMTLNQIKDFKITYIDAGFSPFLPKTTEWVAGPFFLYDSNFLRRYFKLRTKHFPLFLFLKSYGIKEFYRFIFYSKIALKIRGILKIRSRFKRLFQIPR